MDKLLYFPYIAIPNGEWLTRTLLYWDEIASIVPYEYIERPGMHEKYMRHLVEENLVKQVIPEEYVFNFRGFEGNFLEYLKNDPLSMNLAVVGKMGELGNGKILRTTPIHMGKLADLGYELVELGLAKRMETNRSWFEVEAHTAKNFMTYLAFLISNATEYVPATDNYDGFRCLLPVTNYNNNNIKERVRNELRAVILEKILPVPKGRIDGSDIQRFKEKNYESLRKYRNHVEDFLVKYDSINESDRERTLKVFIEESQENIKQISERLTFFGNIDMSFITICSLASSVSPVASSLSSGDRSELIGAVPGLLGAIYATTRRESIADLHSKPLAYATIAKGTRTRRPFSQW